MTYTTTIAGITVAVNTSDASPSPFQIVDNQTARSTAQFCVWDAPGTANYSQDMQVTITDSVYGLQFAGYIDSAQPDTLMPNASKKWTIICKPKRYLSDKRWVTLPDSTETLGGDIVTDLHAKYLAAEGVTANYALRHDSTSATLGAGTLVNTTASPGDLELAAAGTAFTKTETTTADFNTGTLSNVAGSNNTLALTSSTVIKYTGTATANLGTNLYTYTEIYNTSLTINSNDVFVYDVFVSSLSPAISCGLDLAFTDNTYMKDIVFADQNGLNVHPATNMAGYANDQWYRRTIQLTTASADLAGKVLAQCNLGFEGDAAGTYTAYIRNATIQTSGGTVRATIFNGSLSLNKTISNQGYYGVKLSTVKAYESAGQRVSPAYSITSPGIVKSSIITWTSPAYSQPTASTSGNYPMPVVVESSFDGGASWQTCVNHQPIANILPGMNTSGKTITLRQSLALAGPDPTIAPQINDCTFTISPSYAVTKSDAVDTDKTSTDFAAGSLSNVTYYNATTSNPAGEQITGVYRNWTQGDLSGITLFGTPTSNAIVGINNSQLVLRAGIPSPPCEVKARLDFAGQWQNFVCELDIFHLDLTSPINYGLIYRTQSSGWSTANATWAYYMQVEGNSIALYKGTNGGSTSTTLCQRVSVVFTANTMYHLRIVVSGSSHQCYINDILYINTTDTSISTTGYLGFGLVNGVIARQTAYFNNFGVMSSSFTGNRVHSSLALNALSSVENSLIQWNSTEPGNTSVLVESSINGGSTYATCTNGAVIPQLTPGVSTSGVSLLIRETLTTQNANATPVLSGITALIVGNYNATGTRVSPSLAIGVVGHAGSSSITWTSNTPTGTTLLVEESLIGATGAWTTATNGAAIPTITSQPAPVSDSFAVSSAGNFTSTNYAGVNATWTFDTANSRLNAVNGTNGLYVWGLLSSKDVQFEGILNQAASCGIIWRYTNTSNFYLCVIADASAGTNPNTVKVYKRVAGVTSGVLVTGTIAFARGTYHNLRVIMNATMITVYFDGGQVATVTDAGLAGPGSVGLQQSSTTTTNWYSIRGQQMGDDVTGKSVWTRCTLTSTDPTTTPSVSDLAASVRGAQIMNGLVIGAQAYQYGYTVSGALDDIAKKCAGYSVGITDTGALTFQSPQANPADWPLATVNGDVQWSTRPILKRYSPLYRNRSVIIGGIDITALIPDTRMGDGFTQTWILQWPVAIAPLIALNGQPALVGVQGVDVGMDFYYQIGSKTISQDVSETPPSSSDIVFIPYYGQIQVVKTSNNVTQQTALAALDGSSGIVEVVESVAGLGAVAAQALADARVAQYAILSQDFEFTTLRGGLKSGQLLQCFIPEYGIPDALVSITSVTSTIKQGNTPTTTLVYYDVKCTSGPNVGSWTALFLGP